MSNTRAEPTPAHTQGLDIAIQIPTGISEPLMKNKMDPWRVYPGLKIYSITAHNSSRVSGKMLMPPLSLIAALTSFIVKPDESTGRVHSHIHLCAAPGSSSLPVTVSDRQMTSAWPRAALGMWHLILIKQNKGGLWWYHLRVAHPPAPLTLLPLSHNTRLSFPSNRVSVSLLCV